MKSPRGRSASRGVITLFVSVLVLLMTTIMIALAFKLSSTNLQVVGNSQTRAEAIAAAEKVLAHVASSQPGVATFHEAVKQEVDIDLDGVGDFEVNVDLPECVRATPVPGGSVNSVTLGSMMGSAHWNSIWQIRAVAVDTRTRSRVQINQGLRYILTETEKSQYC